jgi:hypothetical protein
MRLHPITCCIAATTMGTLLGVNLFHYSFDGSRIRSGWPLTHEWVTLRNTFDHLTYHVKDNGEWEATRTKGETIEESEWSSLAMAGNIALGALISLGAIILCECLLRGPRFIRTVRSEKSLPSLTWWVVVLVLGVHIALNCPRGNVQEEQTFGWPLTYKRVFPSPFGNDLTYFRVGDIDKGRPSVLISTTELTTRFSYPALLTDFLIAILAAATAGILTQQVLSRSAPAANQPQGSELTGGAGDS